MRDWIQKPWHRFRRAHRWVGVDVSVQAIQVVVLTPQSMQGLEPLVHLQVPLPSGAINGAEIDDFDQVAQCLQDAIDPLNLIGCPAACAIPALAVRTVGLEAADFARLQCLPDHAVIAHLINKQSLPPGDWCVDLTHDDYKRGYALVARQEAVLDRYALLEQVQLVPAILDVDTHAADRAFKALCVLDQEWPQLWGRWRNGFLSLHLQGSAKVCVNNARYCWRAEEVPQVFEAMLKPLLREVQGDEQACRTPLWVRFSGLSPMESMLMQVVATHWPHTVSRSETQYAPFERLIDQDWAVAYGLALHPGLR